MSEILGTLFKYLLSLLGVAAVVLILYQVFGANKVQNAVSDMTQLQANIQALYSGQGTFTSLTNTVAIGGKLAPSSMISGAAMTNPWGGAVTVSVNGTMPSQFNISEAGVPTDACAKMIVGMPSIVSLSVNGALQTLPMDAGTSVTACGSALNTVVGTYGH